jgi:WD40-like Beta Propeller Repeat
MSRSLMLSLTVLLALVGFQAAASGSQEYQPSPPQVPEIFARGTVSTAEHEFGLTTGVDWQEIFFTRLVGDESVIMTTQWLDGRWAVPSEASFSGSGNDGHPFISPGGQRLTFTSRRPCPGAVDPHNIWIVERDGGKWGAATAPGSPLNDQTVHAPTVAPGGTIWDTGLVRFAANKNRYDTRRRLSPPIKGSHPTASPDGNWLVFAARRSDSVGGKDLYVIGLSEGEPIGQPVALLGGVNSSSNESSPTFSGDGTALFFSRSGDIYWIATAQALPETTSEVK